MDENIINVSCEISKSCAFRGGSLPVVIARGLSRTLNKVSTGYGGVTTTETEDLLPAYQRKLQDNDTNGIQESKRNGRFLSTGYVCKEPDI